MDGGTFSWINGADRVSGDIQSSLGSQSIQSEINRLEIFQSHAARAYLKHISADMTVYFIRMILRFHLFSPFQSCTWTYSIFCLLTNQCAA